MKEWNVLDGLDSEEAVIGFLAAAFETPNDKEHIKDALAIAIKAIDVYGLNIKPSAPLSAPHTSSPADTSLQALTRAVIK